MASRAQQKSDRRAKAEAVRRAQERAERRRRAVTLGIPALVVVAAVAVIVPVALHARHRTTTGSTRLDVADQIIPSTPTGTAITQPTPKRVANRSGISGVLAYDTQGWPGDGASHPGALQHDHVTTPIRYAVTPPVGGPHDGVWMNAGVYTKPIPSERAVHNLEHGAVWITYRPDLSAADVRTLQAFVTKQSLISEAAAQLGNQANRYVDLSPWASNALPAPVVISAWGYQLRVSSPTDKRLQEFVDRFRHNRAYTPEYGSPVDGVPVQTGGRPAMDGGTKANPSGSAPG